MISLFWSFMGLVVGLLVSVTFTPPLRDSPQVPTPDGNETLHTKTGCVKFTSTEVPCVKPTSLNFIAAQHK
jgi:hypothetical protein